MPFPAITTGMLPADTFAGRAVAITGGGTGLGRSFASYLLTLGARVAICGRREEIVQQTAAELGDATGGKAFAMRCDVREPDQVEKFLEAAAHELGPLFGLVNSAAGNFICPTERLSYNAFSTVVDIVLKGTANCTLALGKRWIADRRPGTIVNIVTTYAWTGSGYVVPSATAKAGVLALTRSLAVEWAKYGIRTNAVAPGPFPTEGAWSRLLPGNLSEKFGAAERVPAGRMGEHGELSNLVAYLLSDYSGYINGECIVIDGGEWLHGAGEFNHLESLSAADWDALQAARPPKTAPKPVDR